MNLTGKQLIEQGIITGEIADENIQQHGVDLNVIFVRKIFGPGFIPKTGKTRLPQYSTILPVEKLVENGDGKQYVAYVFDLKPGTYQVEYSQGCNIPNNQRLKVIHRSSVLRSGALAISALFDAGFKTESIGSMLTVNEHIIIEKGARIAQIYADRSNFVENLYNGQFQGDQQRVSGSTATRVVPENVTYTKG